MKIIGIILLILSVITWIGSFGEFDNRAQAGGAIIGAAFFGIVGILLLIFSSRKNRVKDKS